MLKQKNNFSLLLSGRPQDSIENIISSGTIAVHPSLIPFIKAKELVKKGDHIKAGSPLFFDKRKPMHQFLSPQSGTISNIIFGERRRLEKIEIVLDEKGDQIDFPTQSDPRHFLLETGFWPAFRQFPFGNVPDSSETPPYIIISLENLDSFAVDPNVLLQNNIDAFRSGLSFIKKISAVKLIVSEKNQKCAALLPGEDFVITGNVYPATDPGVVLFNIKKDQSENKAWMIKPHHVIELGHLLLSGTLKKDRLVAIGGPVANCPGHFNINMGESIEHVLQKSNNLKTKTRLIDGGVLAGTSVLNSDAFGFDMSSLTMIDSNYEPEILSFLSPGVKKASYSKTFLSSLLGAAKVKVDDHLNGGYRDCVSCNFCEEVCPVNLDPRTLLKEIKGGELEEAMKQGLLDYVPTGICTFVCPAKIDLDGEIKKAKDDLYEELIK